MVLVSRATSLRHLSLLSSRSTCGTNRGFKNYTTASVRDRLYVSLCATSTYYTTVVGYYDHKRSQHNLVTESLVAYGELHDRYHLARLVWVDEIDDSGPLVRTSSGYCVRGVRGHRTIEHPFLFF